MIAPSQRQQCVFFALKNQWSLLSGKKEIVLLILAQRIYALILGYEDVNVHDQFRHDPAWEMALSKLDLIELGEAKLAGKSTIKRSEYCPETVSSSLSVLK